MAAAHVTETPATPTNRHDRAALGVIASYVHELSGHSRAREDDDSARALTRETVDDELADCLAWV
jgi:hypothetical protein